MAVKKGAKKAAAKTASPKRKSGGKRKATAAKTATKGRPAKAAGAGKGASVSKPEKAKKTAKKPKGKFSSMNVNLGHIFSLRPRVGTSFRQADFLTARHLLRDESYANVEEAARAVAEKALAMTHEGPPKRGFRPGR
jgi:hypothetical protein